MSIFAAGAGVTSVLGSSTLSLLDAGRSNAPGIGLSANARAITTDFLNQTRNGLGTILSSGLEDQVGNAQIQIAALRAGKSNAQLAPSLRGTEVDTQA